MARESLWRLNAQSTWYRAAVDRMPTRTVKPHLRKSGRCWYVHITRFGPAVVSAETWRLAWALFRA